MIELGGIKDELNNLHSDLELLKKAFHMVHRDDPKLCNKLAISVCFVFWIRVTLQETPEIRMFQKMLASPYAVIDNQAKVTTSHASEPVDEEKELLKTIMVPKYSMRFLTSLRLLLHLVQCCLDSIFPRSTSIQSLRIT